MQMVWPEKQVLVAPGRSLFSIEMMAGGAVIIGAKAVGSREATPLLQGGAMKVGRWLIPREQSSQQLSESQRFIRLTCKGMGMLCVMGMARVGDFCQMGK